ncbi:MAG: hypothetical protein R3F59_08770 [Myxococcota bacterium]
MGRTPVFQALLGASCLSFGACGLALWLLEPQVRSPLARPVAATVAPPASTAVADVHP